MTDELRDELRDAATVILLREAPGGFETFLLKRSGKASFMAHARVYPGGTLDPEDLDAEVLEHISGRTAADAAELLREPEARAVGLFLAAIRETFEEAGVLLAHRRGEAGLIQIEESDVGFAEARRALHDYEMALSELAEREDLVFPLDRLAYFAHWITPFFESKRFDTHFFVARMPGLQDATHDAIETTDADWIRPFDAIERNRRAPQEFYLAPPTLRTLERLSEFDRIEEVFAWCGANRPPTLLPHFEATDDGMLLLLPGDPEYPDDDPRYAVSEPVEDGITRLRMDEEGRWLSER